MNRIHRQVWSRHLGAYVVVAETTKSRGKSCGASGALLASVLLTMAGGALAGPNDLPGAGKVSAGAATIAAQGSAMTVTQTTDRAAINWQSFNIGKDSTVNFVQPGAGSVALNRIVGNEGSVIDGALKANGQVFILNPNGVLFGQGARVDTAGLVATTLGLSDADFMAGKSRFNSIGGAGGAVVNQGSLNAQDGGYIALLGAQVKNDGAITARLGSVALAAGDMISLNFNGDALVGVAIDEGALDALVANGGAVRADGGLVVLTARGAEGLVNTLVNNTGEVRAQTVKNHAGTIYLLGEDGKVELAGSLDASAPGTGHGGFIETSGRTLTVKDGSTVTTRAAAGASGTWLIDPTDFNIAAGAGTQSTSGIGADTLQTALGAGNVTIQTQAAGSDAGDINVNAPVAWNTATTLTLSAWRNINVNESITAGSASGAVSLEFGQGAVAASNAAGYAFAAGKTINLQAGNNFVTKLGSDGSPVAWTVVSGLGSFADASSGTAQSLQGIARSANLAGNFVLGADIDASTTATWDSSSGFKPIGTSSTRFTGRFDGLGHTIEGLWIARSDPNYPQYGGGRLGLFGTVGGTAVLRNVSILDAHVQSKAPIGGYGDGEVGILAGEIVGTSSGARVTVSNVHTTGAVVGDYNTAGLVGWAQNVNIDRTGTTIDITNATTNGQGVPYYGQENGGLVGRLTDGSVSRSESHGTVRGTLQNGGLVGDMRGTASISQSYSTADVIGLAGQYNGFLGGLVGVMNNGTIADAYARGNVTDLGLGTNNSYTAAAFGALIGRWDAGAVSHTYATGTVTAAAPGTRGGVGGLIGTTAFGSTTTNVASTSFWDVQTTGIGMSDTRAGVIAGTGSSTATLNTTSTFTGAGWDFTLSTGVWGRKDPLNDAYPVLRTFGYTDPLALTLAAASKTYGDANPTFASFTVAGCPTANCVTAVSLGSAIGLTTGVGSYAYNGANVLSLTFSGSYNASQFDLTVPDNFTVTPRVISVAAANGATHVYDSTPGAGASLLTLGNVVNGDAVNLSGSAVLASKDIGARAVTGLGTLTLDNGNYTLTGVTPSGTVQITARPVGVAALDGATRTYDSTSAAASGLLQITGILSGDTANLGGSATLASKNAGAQGLALGGLTLDNANYTLAGVAPTGTVAILPRTLNLTFTVADKVFDGSAAASATTSDNRVSGDQLAVNYTAAFADQNAGNGKPVTIGGLALGGADAANYQVAGTAANGVTGNLAARSVTYT